MPYVSPRGNVKTTAPPRRKSTAPMFKEAEGDYEQGLAHMASKELGEVIEGRDEDPEVEAVMEGLDHWSGWTSIQPHKHHLDGTRVFEDDEGGSFDPFEDVDEAMARLKMEDVDESMKNNVFVNEHEVDSETGSSDKKDPLRPDVDVEMKDEMPQKTEVVA